MLSCPLVPPYKDLTPDEVCNSTCPRLVSSQKVNEVQKLECFHMTAFATNDCNVPSPSTILSELGMCAMILTYPKCHTYCPLSNFQANAQPQSIELIHDPMYSSLRYIVLTGTESGYVSPIFPLPPPADLSQHRVLCDTYDFIRVDVLGGQSINEISRDLKPGQSEL